MNAVVKKEIKYIAAGTVVLSAVVQLVWSLFFDYDMSVFLGGLWGGTFAIVNFILMALTVQKATSEDSEMMARKRMQSSYSLRMSLTIFITILAVIIPAINWIMSAISLFFPRITILVMPLFRSDLRKKGGNG
ncbi:MAG: ATP synthase subunit I [Clostridia bacterium]|nr:ATP synthase subunit I [Clostridia bacterium]MBQ2327259.1 ATP synthase subunit I [Clostridia bacterium]MBQ2691665.1 ATP synthase subunit I [Clostridia bacterium]MBQ3063012.1 ATP synthase subunit I [Clostridia bacterium]MBQ9966680.1 ATP synthase subunit I [Clostridia bacterium]